MERCKECGEEFSNDRGLHAHLKLHKLYVADYYCKHFPRKDLLTNNPLPFENKDDYFSTYFSSRQNLLNWLSKTPQDKKAPIILDMLEHRVKSKSLKMAPNEVELFFAGLPPISEYKLAFGSYSAACEACDVKPYLTKPLPVEWNSDFSHKKIFVDTREQKYLQFANSEYLKLDTGDYAVSGDDFAYTFVDRKSFADWAATLIGDNLERFRREIKRCKLQNCFLWVIIETDLNKIEETNSKSHHKHNLSYVSHNMRVLQEEFAGTIQFAFSGNREQSQFIIPKLLCLGNKCWEVDLQYHINEKKI